ncbi:leukocyte cell-derived chemotaxin-2 [Lagopus muta]|uniref:leukocyte cell-derived chemotaxin-2 n=1 Tax=Lagopus muta TaxID=64668 RepID=UPI00209CD7C2|nr:leukocyte cell-derived chemotaxin-2 [Lagopus muta]
MPALSLIALLSLVSTVFTRQWEVHPPQQQGRHWAQICSGNPFNKIRGCDRYGCGNYGASRQGKGEKHKGVDVICTDGSTVYAPFSGQLSGPIRFFHNGNAIDDGVQISGSGYCVKLVCIHPIRYHGQIQKGQQLGRMLPMQKVFPGIVSHIHVENCDQSDPTNLLRPDVLPPRPPFPQHDTHWAAVCSGNPTNEIRGCDKYGCGYFGAPRRNGKGEKHKGVDVICADGATVYAPFSGELSGPIKFFHNGNAIDDGVQIRGSGFCVKLLCIHPIRYSGRISKGQALGRMLPMQRVFPGITSHIHVENCDRSDPTSNLERGKQRRK